MTRVPLAILVLVVFPLAAAAIDDMQDEETIAELLSTPETPQGKEKGEVQERRWGILPEIGYGPDTGPKGGVKFQHRDIADLGVDFDVHGSYALNRQQSYTLGVGTPHLFGDRFLALFRAHYDLDPQLDFFGLGNNDVGPEPASTEAFQRTDGKVIGGWRPWPSLALSAGIGLRHVHISRGQRNDAHTFTVDTFPSMPGIKGGFVMPVNLSLVWTTRKDVVRPIEGWRLIMVVAHTNKSLLSDFKFTRFVGDVSYLFPIWGGRHVFGLRVNGGYINGPRRQVPFWQLEELGGDDTLRGFFPHRFLGWARAFGTAEYRAKIYEFDFFSLWRVQVDGAVFGEVGRVFISSKDLREEFALTDTQAKVASRPRFSYGGGLRLAMSQAIIARLDAGFSEEERGLIYLTFGHPF